MTGEYDIKEAKMETDWGNFKTKQPMDVVIVGAGVAGLMAGIALAQAGHRAIILESTAEISEIGAGIQIAPNASRILSRYSLLAPLLPSAIELSGVSSRRWANDKVLANTPFTPYVRKAYGTPLLAVHRADLLRVLLDGAKAAGVHIRTGCRVIGWDEKCRPRVRLATGEWVHGDLVVAADGVRSTARQVVAGESRATPTGDAAYRVSVRKEEMEKAGDTASLELLSSVESVRWMGPGRHIMAYPVRQHQIYNMVLLHPAHGPANTETWTRRGKKSEMLTSFAGWSPTVQRLLGYVRADEVLEWALYDHAPLKTWRKGRMVLMGDAAHPMVPYVAQGAAQGIEDAVALAVALTAVGGAEEALEVWEKVRKRRAERIQASATETGVALHLEDGEAQRERDRRLAGKMDAGGDRWTDGAWQKFMWGHDVMEEALREARKASGDLNVRARL